MWNIWYNSIWQVTSFCCATVNLICNRVISCDVINILNSKPLNLKGCPISKLLTSVWLLRKCLCQKSAYVWRYRDRFKSWQPHSNWNVTETDIYVLLKCFSKLFTYKGQVALDAILQKNCFLQGSKSVNAPFFNVTPLLSLFKNFKIRKSIKEAGVLGWGWPIFPNLQKDKGACYQSCQQLSGFDSQ